MSTHAIAVVTDEIAIMMFLHLENIFLLRTRQLHDSIWLHGERQIPHLYGSRRMCLRSSSSHLLCHFRIKHTDSWGWRIRIEIAFRYVCNAEPFQFSDTIWLTVVFHIWQTQRCLDRESKAKFSMHIRTQSSGRMGICLIMRYLQTERTGGLKFDDDAAFHSCFYKNTTQSD